MTTNPIDRIAADIARLEKERDQLDVRRVEIDEELKPLEITMKVLKSYAGEGDAPVLGNRRRFNFEELQEAEREEQTVRIVSGAVMTAVERILRFVGPMRTSELLEQLKKNGIVIPGKDPEQNLSSLLSRKKDEFGLVVDRRIGWSVKDDAQRVESPSATNTGASDSKPASDVAQN